MVISVLYEKWMESFCFITKDNTENERSHEVFTSQTEAKTWSFHCSPRTVALTMARFCKRK